MATATPKKDNASKGHEAQAEPKTPLILVTKAGKKVETSYYLFEGAEDLKENRLPRIVATKTANRVLKYSNAEEILKDELQAGFVKQAWEGGWTLVEAIKHAADQNATMKLVPRWKKNKAARTGLHDRAKARVISMFNPKVPAEEMVDLLISQLQDQRESLTRTLVKYETELGRREDGTLKFRTKEGKNTGQDQKADQVNV
jgi:hypothetical protein